MTVRKRRSQLETLQDDLATTIESIAKHETILQNLREKKEQLENDIFNVQVKDLAFLMKKKGLSAEELRQIIESRQKIA